MHSNFDLLLVGATEISVRWRCIRRKRKGSLTNQNNVVQNPHIFRCVARLHLHLVGSLYSAHQCSQLNFTEFYEQTG